MIDGYWDKIQIETYPICPSPFFGSCYIYRKYDHTPIAEIVGVVQLDNYLYCYAVYNESAFHNKWRECCGGRGSFKPKIHIPVRRSDHPEILQAWLDEYAQNKGFIRYVTFDQNEILFG